jgi:hypothetical protein
MKKFGIILLEYLHFTFTKSSQIVLFFNNNNHIRFSKRQKFYPYYYPTTTVRYLDQGKFKFTF